MRLRTPGLGLGLLFAALVAPTVHAQVLLHASFDESTTALAAAGRAQPWVDRGTRLIEGRFGQAVEMDPARAQIIFGGEQNVLAGRGTIALWCRLPDLPGPLDVRRIAYVLSKERGYWISLAALEWNEGSFGAHVYDFTFAYGVHEADGLPALQTQRWHHVALSWDQSRGVRFYLDGTLVGSTWGKRAWMERPTPHGIVLDWPGAAYDELWVFADVLSDEQIAALAETNEPPKETQRPTWQPQAAALLASLGPDALDGLLEVPLAGRRVALRQARVRDIRDENMPGWRIMDGRMNLFWPEWRAPVLGDVDYSGSRLDVLLEPGQRFDWISLRGLVGGVQLHELVARDEELLVGDQPMLEISSTPADLRMFWSQRFASRPIDGIRALRQEKMRLHELHLWSVEPQPRLDPEPLVTQLRGQLSAESLGPLAERITMVTLPEERTVLGDGDAPAASALAQPAMVRWHLVTQPVPQTFPLANIELSLKLRGDWTSNVLWVRVVDPNNPMRELAYLPLRLRSAGRAQWGQMTLAIDPWDTMLDEGARLWIELMSEHPLEMSLDAGSSKIALHRGDRQQVLKEFLHTHEHLARSYWWMSSEARGDDGALPEKPAFHLLGGTTDNRELRDTLQAMLRHEPEHRYATALNRVIWERQRTAPVTPRLAPPGAPAWAVWQRELIERYVRMASHWSDRQNPDGQLGGGWNDDTDFPGVFLVLPLLGDEPTTRMFERVYDGLEDTGFLAADGMPRSPGDVLHTTDFFSFRAHLMMFRYGEPRHVQRALTLTRNLRDNWTAVDERGHRRFIGNYFGEDGPDHRPEWHVESGGHVHRTNPHAESPTSRCFLRDALFAAWYSENPALLSFVREFAEGDLHRINDTKDDWHKPSSYVFWPFMSYYTLWGETRFIDGRLGEAFQYLYCRPMWRRLAEGVLDTQAFDQKTAGNVKPTSSSILLATHYQAARDKELLVRGLKSVLEVLEGGWEFRGGEAGGANDHFNLEGQELLGQMALGMGISWRRPGTMIPRIDVSWQGIGTSVAPLVLEGTTGRLRVALFNFDAAPRPVAMRVWRLTPGTYRLRMGADADGDDAIGQVLHEEQLTLARASDVPLTLPARKLVIVELDLAGGQSSIHPMPHPTGPAPDLAVGAGDIYYDLATDRLKVIVHNIGAAPAENVEVIFRGSDGSLLGRAKILRLDAPLDLVPKTAVVHLPAPLRHPVQSITAHVNPQAQVREINHGNNSVTWNR